MTDLQALFKAIIAATIITGLGVFTQILEAKVNKLEKDDKDET